MPEDERKAPFKIAGDVPPVRVWEAVEQKMSFRLECAACGHQALWTPLYMEKKLRKWKGATLVRVAYKLRCGGCRSQYVRICKG